MKCENSGTHCLKVINNFQKIGQTPRSVLQGQKCWYPRKCLVSMKPQNIKPLAFTVQKLFAR